MRNIEIIFLIATLSTTEKFDQQAQTKILQTLCTLQKQAIAHNERRTEIKNTMQASLKSQTEQLKLILEGFQAMQEKACLK
jgi:hypothetical protein